MENRIKEQQLDPFADRTSTHHLSSDQLRLWFSTAAYTLINPLCRVLIHFAGPDPTNPSSKKSGNASNTAPCAAERSRPAR